MHYTIYQRIAPSGPTQLPASSKTYDEAVKRIEELIRSKGHKLSDYPKVGNRYQHKDGDYYEIKSE